MPFFKAHAELGNKDVPLFKPHRLTLSMEAQSFKSLSNFSAPRQRQDLLSGHFFEMYEILLNTTYDLSEFWSFSAGIELAYAESYDNNYRRISRRVRGANMGLYRLFQLVPGIFLVFDGHFFLNFTDNEVGKDEASVGDGVPWFQGGAWFVHELPGIFLYKLYTGFRARPDGYSQLLIYRVGPEFKYKKIGGGVSFTGYMTVVDDNSSNQVESDRQQINIQYNAGSLRYNAKNPHMEEVAVWASYEFETMSFVKIGVNQILGVENTADGFGFLLEIQSSFRVDDGGLSFPYFAKTMKRAKAKNNNVILPNLGKDPREKKDTPVDLITPRQPEEEE